MKKRFQRPDTRFSRDGRNVFVRLQVERRMYEFARAWAAFHAEVDPAGTAEEQLEGYLYMALIEAVGAAGWRPPAEIEALYPAAEAGQGLPDEEDDGIPF